MTIATTDGSSVSGLLLNPAQARACYVMAHGAGAGMEHPFMEAAAQGLHDRGVATLRYQFAFMEKGSKRPDPPRVAQTTVRAAVACATRLLPSMPLIAGGKSYGGRMTSQAQAANPLPNVVGLALLGFPLHPAGKPAEKRAEHLAEVEIPMLFLQGTRDALADIALLGPVIEKLGAKAMLVQLQDADHSFHVPSRSGRTDAEVLSSALDATVDWLDALLRRSARQA